MVVLHLAEDSLYLFKLNLWRVGMKTSVKVVSEIPSSYSAALPTRFSLTTVHLQTICGCSLHKPDRCGHRKEAVVAEETVRMEEAFIGGNSWKLA